jgi:hypothetical protein
VIFSRSRAAAVRASRSRWGGWFGLGAGRVDEDGHGSPLPPGLGVDAALLHVGKQILDLIPDHPSPLGIAWPSPYTSPVAKGLGRNGKDFSGLHVINETERVLRFHKSLRKKKERRLIPKLEAKMKEVPGRSRSFLDS